MNRTSLDKIFGHSVPEYKIHNIDSGGYSNWKKDGVEVWAAGRHPNLADYEILLSQTLKEIYATIGASCDEYDPTSVWGLAEMSARAIISREFGDEWKDYAGQGDLYNQMNSPYHAVIEPLWANRTDFNDYLVKALAHFKDNPLSVKMPDIRWNANCELEIKQ
ncbi:MAG: hypothetical protein FWE64_03055 [Alphaproteobacteria bacterium]|nr:hypothetical protein [Alphaproteobacteria bacterium]